jgi:predicted nucleic acid-binding protein
MEDIVKLKDQLRRARKTALILSTICVLSLMFAIFKHAESSDASKLAEEQRILLLEEQEKAVQLRAEADRQRIMTEEALLVANKTAEDCLKRK